MDDLAKLKKENKQLRALLKNAVELLNKYKDHLQPGNAQPAKKKKSKSAAKAR